MIVIEGMDGSGKTTLAKRLAKDLKIPYFHHGAPAVTLTEFRRKCMRSTVLFQRPIVQDRTPLISECIYGEFKPGEPFMLWGDSQHWIKTAMIVLIYCRPAKHIHRPDEYESAEYIEWLKTNWSGIQARYDTYMAQMHAIRYDWTNKGFEAIAYNGIVELCNKKLDQLVFNEIPNNS